jgi:hypothetical protein
MPWMVASHEALVHGERSRDLAVGQTNGAQFGEGVFARAEERAAALKANGDIDGWATWLRIAAAILEL